MTQVELSRETLIAKMVIEHLHTLQRLNERPKELEKWDKDRLIIHFKELGLADDLAMTSGMIRSKSKQRLIELIVEQEIDETEAVERLEEMGVDVETLEPLIKLYMPDLT